MTSEPSGRKLVAIIAILAWILVWTVLVASLSRFVGRWPELVQAPFYLVMGIVWIFPLRPIIRWSQTGSWRSAAREDNDHQS